MINRRNIAAFILLNLLVCVTQAEEFAVEVTAEQWAIPRHGERIIKMPGLKSLVSLWHQDTEQSIEIRYPGGEDGELWLREMKDWFIALGISSGKIKSIAGSGSKDIIKLTVIKTGGI